MVYQKVAKGDKKKRGFPAAVYNGIVDILNPKNTALSDVPINTASFRNRTVLVENATGEDITAFSVLSIDGFLFDNDDEEPGGLEWNPLEEEEGLEEILSNGLCFKGIKPTEGKPVAVVIEDINDGDIGEAVLSGPAVVSIDMKSRTHQFAAIVEREPGHLQSAEEGNIRILGVKKEEGIKTAAVLLGGGGGDIQDPSIVYCLPDPFDCDPEKGWELPECSLVIITGDIGKWSDSNSGESEQSFSKNKQYYKCSTPFYGVTVDNNKNNTIVDVNDIYSFFGLNKSAITAGTHTWTEAEFRAISRSMLIGNYRYGVTLSNAVPGQLVPVREITNWTIEDFNSIPVFVRAYTETQTFLSGGSEGLRYFPISIPRVYKDSGGNISKCSHAGAVVLSSSVHPDPGPLCRPYELINNARTSYQKPLENTYPPDEIIVRIHSINERNPFTSNRACTSFPVNINSSNGGNLYLDEDIKSRILSIRVGSTVNLSVSRLTKLIPNIETLDLATSGHYPLLAVHYNENTDYTFVNPVYVSFPPTLNSTPFLNSVMAQDRGDWKTNAFPNSYNVRTMEYTFERGWHIKADSIENLTREFQYMNTMPVSHLYQSDFKHSISFITAESLSGRPKSGAHYSEFEDKRTLVFSMINFDETSGKWVKTIIQ